MRLTGIRGWLRAPSNDTYLNSVPVELSDVGSNNGYALLINNGNSANSFSPLRCTAFVKISGDGTLADNTSAYPVVKVFDFSQFAGSINLDRVSLLVCNANTQYSSFYEMFGDGSEMASLIIESGKSAMIAEGKTWSVKNIRSHGPLTASAGTNLNSPRSAVFDGTLNFMTSETDFESLVLFKNVGRKPTAAFSKQTLDTLTINGESYNKTFYFTRLYGGNLIIKKRSSGFLYHVR